MRVLVTGATGFVGSHTLEALTARGHRVRALARSASRLQHREGIDVEVALGDVTEAASLDAAMADCEAVVHVAGTTRALNEAGFARINTFGARLVAEAAVRAGARRLVLVSSLAARGPSDAGQPVSAYGRSKRGGEEVVLEAAGDRLEVVVVRPTAVYGPRDQALLPFFRLATFGLRPVMAGGGVLTLVHVQDLAAALASLVNLPGVDRHRFEVTDGRSYAWPEVVGLVAQAVGRPGGVLPVPRALFAVAAAASDALAWTLRRPQIFGRDKLREMAASWQADPRPLWDLLESVEVRGFERGAVETARSYREAGWLPGGSSGA